MDSKALARFLIKVNKTDLCWLWTSAVTNGYPVFWYMGQTEYAHRLSYEHFVGPIPEGWTVDHVHSRGCISKLCVKPDHLEAVELLENIARYYNGRHAVV